MSRSDGHYLDSSSAQAGGATPGGEAADHTPHEPTFSLGAVVRATGVSEHTLRAWERRNGALTPLRTDAGTRRYRSADIERVRLLKRAVDAGERIGRIAGLEQAELEALVAQGGPSASEHGALEPLLAAVRALDTAEVEHQLGQAFTALGPRAFALELALPLLSRVGIEWEAGRLSAASEHLASATLRSLLGAALRSRPGARTRAPVLFATPSGEFHELGLAAAAVVAADAGARVLYLGPNLPVEEVAEAARSRRAGLVVLAAACLDAQTVADYAGSLRTALPSGTPLWIGGPPDCVSTCTAADAVLTDLNQLEHRLPLLGLAEGRA